MNRYVHTQKFCPMPKKITSARADSAATAKYIAAKIDAKSAAKKSRRGKKRSGKKEACLVDLREEGTY